MTWINYLRPVISCPGILPLILTLFWSRQTRLAAIVAPILGFVTGLAVWLATAKSMYGAINIDTTSSEYPALYAAIASFFSPGLYAVVLSLYKPYRFDWREFLRIEMADEAQLHAESDASTLNESGEQEQTSSESGSIKPLPNGKQSEPEISDDLEDAAAFGEKGPLPAPLTDPATLDDIHHPFDKGTLKELYHWLKVASIMFVIVVLVTFVAWPLPLYRDYIFTKSFFSGWTTVAIIWQFGAFGAVVIFPLYDGRHAIAAGARGVWKSSLEYFNRSKLH